MKMLVTAAVVTGALAIAAGWWLWTPHQDRDVAMPSDDASPSEVVTVYLDALDAGDCETAIALWRSAATASSTWCDRLAGVDDVVVKGPTIEDPAWSGKPPDTQVVGVSVDYDLSWRPLRSDHTVPDGPQPWGYRLARDSDDQPWRLIDQGVG